MPRLSRCGPHRPPESSPPVAGGTPSPSCDAPTRLGARLARALACLVLPLAAFLAAPAQAQTITLVSNTAEIVSTVVLQIGTNSGNGRITQRFTTGSNPQGYNLSSVGIRLSSTATTGFTLTLSIHRFDTTANKNLGMLVHTLTTPSSLTPNSVNDFAAPPGATLEPDTQYLLHMRGANSSGASIQASLAASDNETGEPGWLIENRRRFQGNLSGTESIMMNVKGSVEAAAPSPPPHLGNLVRHADRGGEPEHRHGLLPPCGRDQPLQLWLAEQ